MKIKKKSELGKNHPLPVPAKTKKMILLVILLIITIISLPFTLVILIGLLPTLTILLTDSKNHSKLITVGGFNMAGVFVYLLHVVESYTNGGINIVHDVFNLIIMLGAAGFGLIIYCEMPNLFIFLAKISAQKRLNAIDKKLSELAEEWGQEVIDEQLKTLK